MNLRAALRRIRDRAVDHPLLTVAVVALAVRVVVAVATSIVVDGALFGDEETFHAMAEVATTTSTDGFTGVTERIWRTTSTYLRPLSWTYDVVGTSLVAGRLLSAVFGTVAAVATAAVARLAGRPVTAVVAGLIVALLPSQVLFSSLVLKDAVVWALVATLAIALYAFGRADGRHLIGWSAALAALVFLLGHARVHSTVVAVWALLAAIVLGGRKSGLHRMAIVAAIGVLLPWYMAMGPMGIDVVRDAGSLDTRRQFNAVGGDTSFVDGDGTSDAGSAFDDDGSLVAMPDTLEGSDDSVAADLAHLPTGLRVMLLEPLPWRDADNGRVRLAQFELALWYPLVALAVVGAPAVWRRRDVLAFPVLTASGVLIVYALTEGNFGTAFRHRGELTSVIAVVAAVGVDRLLARRAPAPD